MTKTYNTYPIFEGDQVLTAQHLNDLRTFLEARNLSTRNRLIGSGIVCGLRIVEIRPGSIVISAGLGITSKGYILELSESDCRFITEYKDKPVSNTGEKRPLETPGHYPLFRNEEDDVQIPAWELLTADEEKARDDEHIPEIRVENSDEITFTSGDSETTVKLSDHVLVVYLELDDEDLESCFGDDCDEKGIRRTFNIRKLLVPESVIAATTSRISSSINPTFRNRAADRFICMKRPAFGRNERDYSLTQIGTYALFREQYERVIHQNAGELEQMLRNAWTTWASLLKESFRTDPVEPLLRGTTLVATINAAFAGSVYNVQQRFDCLKHLIRAWNEFLNTAEQAESYCLPDTSAFPRHLVLGPAEGSTDQLAVLRYRHYFRPAAAQQAAGNSTLLAVIKYRRLVEMIRHIRPVPQTSSPVRITPGAPVSHELSDQPIPFYFRIDGDSKLDQVWNPGHALHSRFGSSVSYHKRNGSGDSGGSGDHCTLQPMDHNPDQHSFYRIEGHIGKPFTEVLQALESERERLNLPVKVIGLKLSHNPANITFDSECRFDDLDQQYELLTTDLSCLFEEEITFFTHLRIRTGTADKPDENTGSSPNINTNINTGTLDLGGASRSGAAGTSATGSTTIGTRSTGSRKTGTIASSFFHESKQAAEQAGDGAHFMIMNYVPTREVNITYQTNFVTTGDLLSVQLQKHPTFDFSRIITDFPGLFPDIRIPDLLILKPVQLANQMRAILALLPDKPSDLDAERLSSAFDSMVNIASDYRNDLLESEHDLDGQKAMILYRLDKLIHSCARQKLLTLYQRYRDRMSKYSELRLLKKFAETHSGLEHHSGVPSGGTFVMVYVDENESPDPPGSQPGPRPGPFPGPPVIQPIPLPPGIRPVPSPPQLQPISPIQPSSPFQPFPRPATPTLSDIIRSSPENLAKSISSPISTTDARTLTSDLQAITNTLKLDTSLSAELKDRVSKLEQDARRKIDDLVVFPRPAPAITRNVVVADFSLPYLYKCECPEVSMVVISQIVFSLSKTEFCRNDRSRYEFLTDPAGGIVESSAGGVVAEGNRFFFEPAAIDANGEEVRFSYQINNQTVFFNIRVFNPVAGFGFNTQQNDDGTATVFFNNTSTGAERFEWDFGDGQSSSEADPVHTYRDFKEDRAVVTLTAHRSGCSDRISKQVEIPQAIPVEFSIENKANFPEKTYCTTDDQLFRFHVQPQGSLIEGKNMQGVRQTHDGFVLAPSAYAPGSYKFGYMGEKLTVRILEGPSGDFTHSVLREAEEAFTVRFAYDGQSVKSVTWRIGRREPLTGKQIDVTFDKREGRTHTVELRVLSENGCAVNVTRTLTFDVKIPVEDSGFVRGNLFDDLRTNVDVTRNVTLDNRLFDGGNPVIDETNRVLGDLAREIETADGAERFKAGELNDRIAADFRHLLDNSSRLVTETSKTGTKEEAKYTAKLFDNQVASLIRLVSEEENDVNKTSEMGKLLVHLNTSILKMKEEGIDVDPDKRLGKTVTEAKKVTADQPKLREALLNIEKTLNM